MKTYFVCKTPGSGFVGAYTVEQIQALLKTNEIKAEYVVTESIVPTFSQLMQMGGAQWMSVLDLLTGIEQQPPPKKLIQCPMCEKDVSPHATACPHCGHPLKGKVEQAEQAKQTNLWLRIIVILICLPVVIASLKSCIAGH